MKTEIEVLVEIAEMKRIYSAIESRLPANEPACLLITSAASGEGKTTLLAGLFTIAARQAKKKVLVVDLNWLTPALHTYFGLELHDIGDFVNGLSVADLAQHSGEENLDIITSIDPEKSTSYIVDNSIVAEIVKQSRDLYDLVLIDTRSVFPTNRQMIDPVSFVPSTSGVVLTVLANSTSRQQVKRAQNVLKAAHADILGVVLNQWKNPIA
ncbi:CpsD/CapB family tyrosine-protein kinase [bacterium]|nr:CpsD/CapB family tyrosine-protein kinase [bacterium]